MTDPRIIPDEVLAEIGRSVIEHCPRCQCVTVKRLIGHGKALAEQVATLEDAFMLATKSAERRKARADAAVQRLADRDKAIRDLADELERDGEPSGYVNAIRALLTEDGPQ